MDLWNQSREIPLLAPNGKKESGPVSRFLFRIPLKDYRVTVIFTARTPCTVVTFTK
jgi:hypothetical protein